MPGASCGPRTPPGPLRTAFAGFVWLAVVVLQGVRRIGGAVLAGLMMTLYPELLAIVTDSQHVGAILFGLGGIVLAKHPDGVLSQFAERRDRRRRRHEQSDRAGAAVVEATEALDITAPRAAERLDGLPAPAGRPSSTGSEGPAGPGPRDHKGDRDADRGGDGQGVRRDSDTGRAGRTYGLIGPNGAGKTTLFDVVTGLRRPTSGFAEVIAELEATILLVEHDVGFVMETCERIIVLDLGRVIAAGAPERIRDDPAVRAAYLG